MALSSVFLSRQRIGQCMALLITGACAWSAQAQTAPTAATAPNITVSDALQQHIPLLDTRSSAAFNGWPQEGETTGGHERGARNLSASWLSLLDDAQLTHLLQQKKLDKSLPIALYGTAPEVNAVRQRLQALGFSTIYTLSDALQDPSRRESLAHYQALVPASWLADLQAGKPVANAPAKGWKVIEVEWGAPKAYLLGHIPKAGYMDTNTLESEPLWNKVDNSSLEKMLLAQGITTDTPVILYGRQTMSAARAANILMYAGVKDVRILDGGWDAWQAGKYPTEMGLPASVTPAKAFGAKIPAHPEYMTSLSQAKALLKKPENSLVSIRSWPEFIGETSGYNYIKAKGDIPGAKWGGGGSDAYHVEDLHNPDGTMLSEPDLRDLWQKWQIEPTGEVAFYCGTGWRASEAFFYAWAMGWPQVSVYDGGWYEWSLDPANPIVTGERQPGKS
ncbi:Thiosulfate sulfurtransferase YnjE precursor [Plesiomonas shigelloides]|nr:Thiosulfate sulfurtransferase YnjE precursor [Plesiomonas shigelloides]